jgi:hypothetical protein
MKKLNDEDIQRMLADASDNPATTKDDLKAYRLLFTQLGEAPPVNLVHNFAAKVAAQVQAKRNRSSIYQLFLMITAGLAVFAVVIYCLLLFTNYSIVVSLKVAAGPYKWAIAFIILSLFIIQYVDQKLVKEPKRLA